MKKDKKSFFANSRYERSGWSNMKYDDKVRLRKDQYRDVLMMKYLDAQSTRKHNLMLQSQKMTL